MITSLQSAFSVDVDAARERLSSLTYADMGVEESTDLWLGDDPVTSPYDSGLHDDVLRAFAEFPVYGDQVQFSYHWVARAYDSSAAGHLVLAAGPAGSDPGYVVAALASTHSLAASSEGSTRDEFAVALYASVGEALKRAIDSAAG